jgi:hypothetical protein
MLKLILRKWILRTTIRFIWIRTVSTTINFRFP